MACLPENTIIPQLIKVDVVEMFLFLHVQLNLMCVNELKVNVN